jgi:hypothetical protein
MEVNGLQLPASYVRLAREGQLPYPGRVEWRLRKQRDAYGRPWEAYILRFYEDEKTMLQRTAEFAQTFAEGTPEEFQEANEFDAKKPGFIPFFHDFSKIVQFGDDGGSMVYCFDFRENPEEPSVISWEDAYWRRVARNFDQFVGLWKRVDPAELLRELWQ